MKILLRLFLLSIGCFGFSAQGMKNVKVSKDSSRFISKGGRPFGNATGKLLKVKKEDIYQPIVESLNIHKKGIQNYSQDAFKVKKISDKSYVPRYQYEEVVEGKNKKQLRHQKKEHPNKKMHAQRTFFDRAKSWDNRTGSKNYSTLSRKDQRDIAQESEDLLSRKIPKLKRIGGTEHRIVDTPQGEMYIPEPLRYKYQGVPSYGPGGELLMGEQEPLIDIQSADERGQTPYQMNTITGDIEDITPEKIEKETPKNTSDYFYIDPMGEMSSEPKKPSRWNPRNWKIFGRQRENKAPGR